MANKGSYSLNCAKNEVHKIKNWSNELRSEPQSIQSLSEGLDFIQQAAVEAHRRIVEHEESK